MNLLHDRVVLVSGGTQGVGAGIVRAAAGEGATVAFTGRRPDAGDKLTAELASAGADGRLHSDGPGRASASHQLSPPNRGSFRPDRLPGQLSRSHDPRLAAGHLGRAFRAAHARSTFGRRSSRCRSAVADMVRRGEPGTIVNIISMAQHGGQPYLCPYAAAKAGLAGLTRNAAFAHRWDKIRINGVNIGWTQTEGEDATQRQFHGADDRLARRRQQQAADGKNGPSRRGRRLCRLLALRPQRRRDRLHDRLGSVCSRCA